MALDDALEALAAARPDHIDAFAVGKDRHVDDVARLGGIAAGLHLHLAANARRRHAGLLEVARARFVLFRRLRFDEAQLHRLVSVVLRRLHLCDDARTGLEDGRGRNRAVSCEQLRHADFLSDQSSNHDCFLPGPRRWLMRATEPGLQLTVGRVPSSLAAMRGGPAYLPAVVFAERL